jgi:hypothetical protein
MGERTCSVPNCQRKSVGRGWCGLHYQRWQRHGDPEHPHRYDRAPAERFWEKVRKVDDGCWTWVGAISSWGYGNFWDGTRYVKAHRFAYELIRGPIRADADDSTVDHLCRNRACVNPDHLEVVSNKENILRGTSFAAVRSATTHCPQGHEYVPENIYTPPGRSGRECLTCKRRRTARWNARKGGTP